MQREEEKHGVLTGRAELPQLELTLPLLDVKCRHPGLVETGV